MQPVDRDRPAPLAGVFDRARNFRLPVRLSLASWKAVENFSFFRSSRVKTRRRGGFQYLLSSATGLTQIGDAVALDNRLLFSSNGQRPTSNSFAIDGFSLNLGLSPDESAIVRGFGNLPALTASGGLNGFAVSSQIQELAVKTMSGAKEQRVGGAEINISSRSGNNSFRGSVYEIFGHEKLNANDFFANSRGRSRPPARLNQFGGALGGYLRRNSAWFFGNYEGLRLRQAGFNVSEVPVWAARQNAPDDLRRLFDAFPVQAGGPTTADGFAEFAAAYTNPAGHDIFGLRLDFQPRTDWRFGGRYNFARANARLRGDRDFSLNTRRRLATQTDSLFFWSSYTPTSNVVIDGRAGFTRHRLEQEFSLDDFGGADPSAALFATPFDFLKFDLAGKNSALAVGRPLASAVRQFQASGRVDWIKSFNYFTFGADFRRLTLEAGAARTERGVIFERAVDGAALSTARVGELRRDLTERPEIKNFSLYAQDSFNVTTRLNLNLGLRWDADFASRLAGGEIGFRDASQRMPARRTNFAPRAGAVLAVFNSARAVVRAGAGLYYDYSAGAAGELFTDSFPFARGQVARRAAWTAAPTDSLNPLLVFDRDLKTPRSWHFFAEYQQELFRNHILTATFTSSLTRDLHLARTVTNADPLYNYVRLTTSDGRSRYDALQLRFERRFAQSFSFNARYTLSKTTDNFSPDTLRETNFVADDLTAERGAAGYDARHQLSLYGLYDLPAFFSGGWLKRLTEDWTLSVFANARSAFPLTVGYTRINDFGKEFVRADRVANAPAYLDGDPARRLNPAAFAVPPTGRQGDLARGGLRGFPFFQLDAGLQRRVRFTNETRLELAINAYNLLNNANFADPSANLGTLFASGDFLPNAYFGKPATTFGSAGYTPFYLYGGARRVQFSVRFVF